MTLTAAQTATFRNHVGTRRIVKSGVEIFQRALVGLEPASGHVTNWSATAGLIFLGYANLNGDSITGDGTTDNEITVQENGWIMEGVTVAGASATTNGARVYASDEDTLTLTPPAADAHHIGHQWGHITGTTVDVKLLDAEVAAIVSRDDVKYIGSIPLVTVADGDMKTGIPLQGHGTIVDFFTITEVVTTDADADTVLGLEIGGTNVTGAAITLGDTGDATGTEVLGAKASSTAITALNEYSDGDLLDVEASGTTAFADGQVGVYIVTRPKAGV